MKDMKRIYDMKNAIIRAVEKRLFSRCSAPVHFPFISRSAAVVILCILLGFSGNAWAYWTTDKDGNAQADNASIKGYVSYSGSTYYVLDEAKEYQISASGSGDSHTYYLTGPGAYLTFSAARSRREGLGDIVVKSYNGSQELTEEYSGNPGGSYGFWGSLESYDNTLTSKNGNINLAANKLIFSASWGSYSKNFKNVKVTMASYCEPEVTSVAFGSNTYLNTDTKTVKIYWSNTGPQTISKTGDTDRFTVSHTSIPSKAGYYGNTVVSITYKRDQVGNDHTMKLTVNGKTITVTGTTTKGTPSIDCSQVSASGLTYGHKLSESTISGPNASYKNGSYPGTYTWTRSDASSHTALGCTNYSVTFTPDNTNLNSVTCTAVQVPITKVAQTISWSPTTTYVVDQDIQLNGTTSGHDATVYYTSSDETVATIEGNWVRMHKAGDITITAHADATCNYNAATTVSHTFQFRHRPVVQWRLTGENDHIYSGDFLTDIAYATYSGQSFNMDYAYTSSPSGILIQTEAKNKLLVNKELTREVTCTVTATFDGNDTYCPVSASHTYTIEPKATPRFLLNGEDLPAEPVKELRLLIGETADMAFENTDETNGRFSYPIAAQYISYSHNSSAHTGTITADRAGDEVIQFHQTGTTTIFERTRSVHVYVSKHTTTLTTGLDGITCDVEDYIATEDAYTVNAPAEGEPAQNTVVITSSNENIIRFMDGKWRAKNAGTATLTIRQANNDYWTGDTITATITVKKHTPVFTWNPAIPSTSNYNKSYANPVSSTNTDEDCTISFSSSNPNAIKVVNGKLETYTTTASNVAITVTQQGNYKWNEHTEVYYISVEKLPNHVELTINNQSMYNALYYAHSGDIGFDNSNGIRLGGSDRDIFHAPAYNKDDKYIDIQFEGIPSQVTFDLATNQSAATGEYWYVKESADGSSWSGELWNCEHEGESFASFGPINLSPNTHYLRLCYSGNFAGYFRNVRITERKEIVAPASQAFGSGYIGNNPTERTVNVDWYNVKTCTVNLIGTNAAYFQIAEGSNTIASSIDNYSTANLIVRYLHEVAGNHTATLHIESEDGKTADITLTGTTNKALQEIVWREDITPLPKNELYSGAAYATSGLPVVLTAEDPSILQVTNGDQVTGIGVGTTRLFARQAGDTKWEAVNETITVEVTNKTVQHIVWTDRLSNIKRENGQTVTKTLTAYSDADNSLPITYELDAAASAFASVSGNTLTITGWGTGYITARQAGTDDYVAVSAMRKLVSRDPAAGCRPLVLDEPGEKTLHTIDSEEFTLQGEPATIEFDAKCDKVALWGLWVSEYYNGGWHEVAYIERGDMSSSYNHYGPYALNRNATKVKIYTETGATLTRTFKNVEVTLAKYLELRENNMDFSAVEYGQTVLQQFTVDYSNLTGALDVELQNPSTQLEVRTVTLGEDCGDFAKNAVVQIRCTGRTIGTEQNTIVISNRDQRLEVPVSVTVIPVTQQITWNVVSPVATLTTDKVQLVATATSELPVTFTSADNSIAEPYQKEDGSWWLNIRSAGDVVITATQAGNTNYESTTTSRTYSISKTTPTISQMPYAGEIVLPATLNDVLIYGGSATVNMGGADVQIEGAFFWQDYSTEVERINSGYTAVFVPVEENLYNRVSCTLVVPVLKTPQTITWNFTTTEMLCNAEYTFNATASSGMSVRYTSSDPSIAYVDADNRLRIVKGGEVTITAHQDGDFTYAAAADVEKTLTINRFTPTIISLPAAESMLIGRLLSDASLSGGRVELDGVVVEGSFAWEEGNTRVETEAGVFERTVIFTPANTNWYNTLSDVMNVTVEKYAPAIYQSLTGTMLTYGQPLSNAAIEGSLTARDEVKYPQEDVQGTYTWKRPEEIVNAGSPAYATVVFTPDNLDWYKTAEFDIPLTVMPAELPAVSATSQIFYGQILSEASLTNTTYGVIDGGTALIAGTLAWDGSLDMMHYYELGTHTLPVIFTPSDPNYLPTPVAGTATLTVQSGFVFNGADTNWDNINNWLDTNKPTNSNDKVVILSDVDITGEVEVEAMTIRDGVTVTVKDGATLTIGNSDSYYREQYGNIKVQKGGSLILGNGTLEVNNLYIESAMGGRNKVTNEFIAARSAQVENIDKINVHADVYFDLALDANGECSQGWYTFTVPFPVESGRGISRFENGVLNNNIKQGVNYAIMDYHENVRATGAYGWKKFYGTMQPGVCYTMTIDDYHNIYRFRKAQGAALTEQNSVEMTRTEGAGGEAHSGWNCIGNGSLHYAALEAAGITMVQVYDHRTNSYYPEQISGKTFVVGSTFFVQAVENNSLMSLSRTEEEGTLYALKRNRTDVANVLALTRNGDSSPSDRLFVTANYMAQDRYEAGKDVSKFELSSSVAQVYANAYNVKLCAVHTRLDADETIVSLGLYAPANGEYTLGLQQRSENQTVYLLYEGVVVANLTNQDYEIDLNKGTNSSYALLIREQAPAMPTAIDENASDSKAEKFVHNGILYILRDGSLYDATGRKIEK